MEDIIEALEAERYTHTGETLAQVKARVNRERPETPHQRFIRRQHEAEAEKSRSAARLIELINEERKSKWQ